MSQTIVYAPLLPMPLVIGFGVLALTGVVLALMRGLSGWALRGLAALVLIGALMCPSLQNADRARLNDIVIMLVDRTASQSISDRTTQTDQAAKAVTDRVDAMPNTELVTVDVADSDDNAGTQMMRALNDALAEQPRSRIAGIVAVSDGIVHDMDTAPDLPAPLHLLQTGRAGDWDRKLSVKNAPAFAILGEAVTLTVRVDDLGAAPDSSGFSDIDISIDGAPAQRYQIPLAKDAELPITLQHGGRNVIRFSVPDQDGELTNRNNSVVVQINGVRDRLRVLLVSGQPHAGGRTWRNLLKSDSSVDLVHFTILRPHEKQDGVPVHELSLIAFPTRELFLDKVDDFDLIIFDRYKRRGILPSAYLENIARYVREGGAVLVAAGPDFASAQSLARSPLSAVLPARSTARVIEQDFKPQVSDIGQRHPVTAGLVDGPSEWGKWMRQIELESDRGNVVMTGADGKPLLILDRVDEGRVALLASDQAWLWDRGFDGGGPQLELLRRLAHWMMKEPELEEESLTASAVGQDMRITRRTLLDTVGDVSITTPDGSVVELPMTEAEPGRFETLYTGPSIGLYRLQEGDQEAVIGLGPEAPKEFEDTISNAASLRPLLDQGQGGVHLITGGLPMIRTVRAGRPATGRGWIGITPRDAYETRNLIQTALLPPWLVLLLASSLLIGAWLREGRN